MINIYCACQQQSTFHERMAGQTVTCDACGGTLHLVCGETLRDAAGEGDFDAALDMEGKAGSPATRYLLGGVSELQIGRLPDRQIVLPNQEISRQHCKLVRIDFGPSRWKIVDQKSALGVYVNEQRVTEHELQDGDKIQIGTNTFYYVLEGADLVEVDPQDDDESYAEPSYSRLSTAKMAACPSCQKAIGVNTKVCVGCGIHISSGRPLVTQMAIDENKLRASVYQWIRLASIFARLMPIPLPIRSEVHSNKKPYAIWAIAVITTIASLVFFLTRFSGRDQYDFARPNNQFMLWSPYQSTEPATLATLKPSSIRKVAASLTDADRDALHAKYDSTGLMSDYQLSAHLLLDAMNANHSDFHWYQLFTHMFLHDTSSTLNFAMHLGGNMLFLLVLGTRVNSLIGDLVTAVLYVVLGVCAAAAYLIFTGADAHGPMVGASGAIMGLAGMYLVLFPVQRIICAVWIRIGILFFKMFAVRGFWVVLIYFASDVISEIISSYSGSHGGVAHSAHIGGFICGALIALAMLASQQFNTGSGDLPSMIFGKRAWPIFGSPNQAAARRQTLQGSAIFAGAAAGIIPFAAIVLAVYSPTVVEHPAVAMNTVTDAPVETVRPAHSYATPGAEANNQTPDVPESPPASVDAPTAMSPPPTQVNNFQPPGQAPVVAVPRRSLRWRPGDTVAQASPDDAATARFSNNIPRHISHRSKHASDEPALPEGMSKTEIIGLDGGGPYLRVSSTRQPVIGFTIKIGSWGHTTIGSAEPLFAKPDETLPDDTTACMAKDGYVVGGVIVNSIDGADGLCIIFMKKTRNGVDSADSYNSQWFGYTGNGTQTQLDGKGKLIIGTIGRQGMNMNKIGLVIDNTGSG